MTKPGRPLGEFVPGSVAAAQLASKIREYRWDAQTIARQAGIDPGRLSRMLRGQSSPTLREAMALQKWGINPIDWLKTDETETE